MSAPAILQDDVGLVNFTLVQGADKTIKVQFSSAPTLDISAWDFAVAFYVGRELVKSEIISTTDGGIVVNALEKYLTLVFSDASIADIPVGLHRWDLRYTVGMETGQILKGQVTIGKV